MIFKYRRLTFLNLRSKHHRSTIFIIDYSLKLKSPANAGVFNFLIAED